MGKRNSSKKGKKDAQRKPLTKVVNNKQVANMEVLGETVTSPVETKKEENKLSFLFSGIEFLLSIFAFVGIVCVTGLSTIAAFTYISSSLVSSTKEILKEGVDKSIFKINVVTVIVELIAMILLFVIVKCTPTGILALILEIVIKILITIVPGRILMYIIIYITKIFKK